MVNWQVFKVLGGKSWEEGQTDTNALLAYDNVRRFDLDKYVEFADGYRKSINVRGHWRHRTVRCGGYVAAEDSREAAYKFIEIDIDRTKFRRSSSYFENDVIKLIPEEEVTRRRMESVASVDPTALFVTRDGIDRINRGEISEFEYKMVDNSNNTHHFIYRK